MALSREQAIEKVKDPVWFCENILGAELWSKQRDILRSVKTHRRTAVKACHGPGKTFTAAVAVLWFLYAHEGSRVITTATTWTQVRALLWHDINRLHREAKYALGGHPIQTELRLPDGRYALGLSTKPEHVESFQGHHAENLLVVYDEASGIPQPIFDAGEGYMTTPGARQLLIGNPTQPSGQFYDCFHSQREKHNLITISAHDLPWATGEQVSADLAKHLTSEQWVEEHQHWQGTPLWDVKVLGNFPSSSDDTVISLASVEQAQRNTVTPANTDQHVIGCDVARFGQDETVIAHRHGDQIRIVEKYIGKDLMETVGRLVRHADRHDAALVVDDDGLGGGVTDRLRELGYTVTAFRGGAKPAERKNYPNRKSELWFTAAEQLASIDLDTDEQLAADLVSPRYRLDSQGRRTVESKDDMKKRLGRSPDRADAVLLTFAQPTGEVEYGPNIWT